MIKEGKCKVCEGTFVYNTNGSKGIYCSKECRYKDHSNVVKNGYTKELKEKRRVAAKTQMKDVKQIRIRKEKCGYTPTEEQKEHNRKMHFKNSFVEARYTLLKENKHQCQRCWKKLGVKKGDLIVHHKDGQKWNNELDNLQILCKTCHSKIHKELGDTSSRFTGKATVANYVAKILENLGIDLTHPDFKDTPLRVARMYETLFEGNNKDVVSKIKALSDSVFPSPNDQMIIEKNIRVYSMCPHHLLPVKYDISIGYIPNGKVIGISKLTRLAKLLARKPVLQENLTEEIASFIDETLVPGGVAVTITGQHYCMMMRGVEQQNASVITTALRGSFKENLNTRSEFFNTLR